VGLLADPVLDCGICSFKFLDVDMEVPVNKIFSQAVHSSGEGCRFWVAED
jgi:hypothetical protein